MMDERSRENDLQAICWCSLHAGIELCQAIRTYPSSPPYRSENLILHARECFQKKKRRDEWRDFRLEALQQKHFV